jgi:alkylation response protein AidB-like acyl-CoA dehydrogenase
MIELDERLTAWQAASSEVALQLRAMAPAVDDAPYDMDLFLGCEAFTLIRQRSTPSRYCSPLRLGRWEYPHGSVLQQAIGVLELARGDASVFLACPGPALAGIVVALLGSQQQQDLFFSRIADDRTWTFFAMTEPDHGSDAAAMQTRIEDGRLYGVKRYIGNGSRGGIGVVFGRIGPGPLGIRAMLVELPAPGWEAEPLAMTGLRGACLANVRLDGAPVLGFLGDHLPPTRRGLWGAIKTFWNMRTQVAAMATGTSYGILDYTLQHRPHAPDADIVRARIDACRDLVWQAAADLDEGTERGYGSSVAKLTATGQAIATARWAARSLGPGSLAEHPLLEKWTRDVMGFEFMDGTSNIQRLHITRSHLFGGGVVA